MAIPLAGPSVEADRAREPVAAGCREPRVVAAEAEPDREGRAAPLPAQPVGGRAHIRLDALGSRLLHMLPVLEVFATLPDPGRAAEVVDRDRPVPALGEAQRELLVEAVEPAHVREDHDARPRRLVRLG